jgi:hypothetical protein
VGIPGAQREHAGRQRPRLPLAPDLRDLTSAAGVCRSWRDDAAHDEVWRWVAEQWGWARLLAQLSVYSQRSWRGLVKQRAQAVAATRRPCGAPTANRRGLAAAAAGYLLATELTLDGVPALFEVSEIPPPAEEILSPAEEGAQLFWGPEQPCALDSCQAVVTVRGCGLFCFWLGELKDSMPGSLLISPVCVICWPCPAWQSYTRRAHAQPAGAAAGDCAIACGGRPPCPRERCWPTGGEACPRA